MNARASSRHAGLRSQIAVSLCLSVAAALLFGAVSYAGGTPTVSWAYKYGTKYANRAGTTSSPSGAAGAESLTGGGWPRAGEYGMYSFFSQSLGDKTVAKVNLESGNLLLQNNDMDLKGITADLGVTRIYNSLQEFATDTYGAGWNINVGSTVGINDHGTYVDYFAPGGDYATFTSVGTNGDYTSPPGMNATLKKTADGFTLAFHDGTTYNFDPNGLWLSITDRHSAPGYPGGNPAISFTYQYLAGYHQTLTATDQRGRQVSFTVNATSGMTTSMTDGSRTWGYGYDAAKDETSYTDPENKTWHYVYNATHDLTKITDPLGNVTAIGYDTQDRVTSLTRDDPVNGNRTWTFTYNDGLTPQTTVMRDPNTHDWTYTRGSSDGTIVGTSDPLGRTTSTVYTPNGDVSEYTNEADRPTDNNYDANNNLTQTQGPAEPGAPRMTESYTYPDPNADPPSKNPYSPTAYTDANGKSWQYQWDDTTGDLKSKSEGAAGQNPVTFQYNDDGTLASATDANSKVWTYGYTNHDLTSISPPDGSTVAATSAEYDSLHRLSCAIDGNQYKTCYGYDNLDRVTTITTWKLVAGSYAIYDTVTFVYDADGNITSRSDASGTVSYSYDALNELTEETHPGPQTTSYSYDGVGALASLNDGSGTTTYAYDAAGRLTKIHEPTQPAGSHYITYTYPDETHTTITYPNTATVASTFDKSGRLLEIVDKDGTAAHTTLADLQYTYTYVDGAGATQDGAVRASVTDALSGATTYYCYDQTGRLASAGTQSGCGDGHPNWGNLNAAYQYVYDPTGNRTEQTVNETKTEYTYKPANELCYIGPTAGSPCGTGIQFDGDGNALSVPNQTGWYFNYNPKNQTTEVNQFTGANGATYAGQSQVERRSFDDWTFTNDQLGLASRTSPSSGTLAYFTRDPSGRVLGIRQNYNNNGYTNTYLLFDGLGSVLGKTDDTGTLTGHYSYDPYGNTITSTDTAGSTLNPFHYADMYQDDSGLYKAGARYYDPSIGRWTQRDSINNPLDQHGWNPYIYAGDDPINESDPTGMLHGRGEGDLCGRLRGNALRRCAAQKWTYANYCAVYSRDLTCHPKSVSLKDCLGWGSVIAGGATAFKSASIFLKAGQLAVDFDPLTALGGLIVGCAVAEPTR